MRYEYRCPICSKTRFVERPMSARADFVYCPSDDALMNQIIFSPAVKIPSYGHFNNGLGITVANKNSIGDKLKEIHDTTGTSLRQVEDGRPTVKNKSQDYKLSGKQIHEIKEKYNG